MKESLEASKNVHRTLIIVCAVITVFALSYMPTVNPYDIALAQVNSTEYSLNQEIKRDSIRIEYGSFMKIWNRTFISLSEKMKKQSASFKKEMRKRDVQTDGDLREIQAGIKTLEAARDSAAKKGDMAYYKTLDSTLSSLFVDLYETHYTRKERIDQLVKEMDTFLKIKKTVQDPNRTRITDLNYYSVVRQNHMLFDKTLKVDSSFISFYRQHEGKSITKFKELLSDQSKIFSEKQIDNVDVSGISISAKNMCRMAPFLTIGLMLYLLANVLHMGEILKIREHADQAKDFPWIAISVSGLSDNIWLFSILWFPLLSSVLIVCNSDLGTASKSQWLAFYIISIIPISMLLDYHRSGFKDRIYQDPFIP